METGVRRRGMPAVTVAYRAFEVTVVTVRPVADSLVRVTLGGDDLRYFYSPGFDQRVKLIFPLAETGLRSFPRGGADWYSAWRLQDAAARCPMRTYTVRSFRADVAELDIDFVVHGDVGPATRWVNRATAGQELLIVGPDVRSLDGADESSGEAVTGVSVRSSVRRAAPRTSTGGIEFTPGDARQLLLAGDETAAPAICSILESLPADARGTAYIEVGSTGDIVEVDAPVGFSVQWLPRAVLPARVRGSALSDAVTAWVAKRRIDTVPRMSVDSGEQRGSAVQDESSSADAPASDDVLWEVPSPELHHRELYCWIAGEAGCVTTLRRFLVSDGGLDRRDVAFMGYWRDGRPEN